MPLSIQRFACVILALVSGCAHVPTGPSMLVLPGTGKTFEQFRGDDYVCRQFAVGQVNGQTPSAAATMSGVTSAAVGTALGAAAGAAIGGGRGAAIGAGTGLAGGSLVGADAAQGAGYDAQERYDVGYIQCMYAKGHKVPVPGNSLYEDREASYPPPPPPKPATP